MSQESARELLVKAGMFFGGDYEDDKLAQTLNLNDAMYWGCSDDEYVPDDKLEEVASLFWNYGNAGVMYWVSKHREWDRAEFLDVNRMIDFVRNEEELAEKVPDRTKRAYEKIIYTIGDT